MCYNRLMNAYNWQQPDWPNFQYDLSTVHETLFSIAEKMGLISGKLAHLAENLQTEAILNLMVEEAVKTSEIEGEYISRLDVRSSIKNKLGWNQAIVRVHDKRAQGIAELMLDVRNTYKKSMAETKLFNWHSMLLSGSSNPNLKIAGWRTDKEPMQIISGRHGKWIVHYEAPPSQDVPKEMRKFIHWFNDTAPGKPNAIKFPPVRAAIAHLYFESIHPFEDGNGRIGRAIAEKALSWSTGQPTLTALSLTLQRHRARYYRELETANKTLDIAPWLDWFADRVLEEQAHTLAWVEFIIAKTKLL